MKIGTGGGAARRICPADRTGSGGSRRDAPGLDRYEVATLGPRRMLK